MLRLLALTAALTPGLAFAQVADDNLTVVYPEVQGPSETFTSASATDDGAASATAEATGDNATASATVTTRTFGQDVVINDDIDLALADGTIVGDVSGEDPNTLVARVVVAEDGVRDLALSTVGGEVLDESIAANHEIGECNPGVDWTAKDVHCVNLVPVDD